MFPLAGRDFPTNQQELLDSLRGGLDQVLRLPTGRNAVEAGGSYPALDKLILNVTDATPRDDFRPAKLTPLKQPGPSAGRFELAGRPLRRDQAEIALEGLVTDARFEFRRDRAGQNFLTLVDGRDGRLSIRGRVADVNALFLPIAQAIAAEYGVTIDKLDWSLTGHSQRQLAFHARVEASKGFSLLRLRTALRSRGQLAIDDQLNVRFSGLSCEGEGMLSAMVVSLMREQLRRLEQTTVPLASYALGRLRLRSLLLQAEEWVEAEADFGS